MLFKFTKHVLRTHVNIYIYVCMYRLQIPELDIYHEHCTNFIVTRGSSIHSRIIRYQVFTIISQTISFGFEAYTCISELLKSQ